MATLGFLNTGRNKGKNVCLIPLNANLLMATLDLLNITLFGMVYIREYCTQIVIHTIFDIAAV
jgi:hypothetical protein